MTALLFHARVDRFNGYLLRQLLAQLIYGISWFHSCFISLLPPPPPSPYINCEMANLSHPKDSGVGSVDAVHDLLLQIPTNGSQFVHFPGHSWQEQQHDLNCNKALSHVCLVHLVSGQFPPFHRFFFLLVCRWYSAVLPPSPRITLAKRVSPV